MKTSRKIWLVIIALALLACLVMFRPQPDAPNGSGTSRGPSFQFLVIKPRLARPLFGILPNKLEEKLEAGAERRFDHTNAGVKIVSVSPNRLELSADDWALLIETDSKGNITSGTHLLYTLTLAEKLRKLRCRSAGGSPGYLRATSRTGSDALDGNFLIELATCENVETGKVIEWPPAPLNVRGSFKELPPLSR